tara:strand:- start:2181 stop:2834 length:654 start_codon:yes stop_codon:yes gene_type:complete
MKNIIKLSLLLLIFACNEELNPDEYPYPCLDGNCDAFFEIDSLVSPGVFQDENGYWHIEHQGYNYFTIKGQLDELHPRYIINGVPLTSTIFDSNYWIWIDGITFTVPLYSVLGFFTDGDFTNPIPVGTLSYTIEDMAQNHPPLNIAGYQILPDQCMDCPYSESIIGTYSRYTYNPQQQIFFDTQMIGDTAKVLIETTFNTDLGQSVVIDKEFDIIFN